MKYESNGKCIAWIGTFASLKVVGYACCPFIPEEDAPLDALSSESSPQAQPYKAYLSV
jgi:hypothetical protein